MFGGMLPNAGGGRRAALVVAAGALALAATALAVAAAVAAIQSADGRGSPKP
jgi:hypothetical protein